jgi:hypothetical protein
MHYSGKGRTKHSPNEMQYRLGTDGELQGIGCTERLIMQDSGRKISG